MSRTIARRTFIQGSAGALLGGLAASGLRAQTQAVQAPRLGANDEIRTAILGIRGQGRHHINYHQASKGIRIAALCDIDESLFAERAKIVKGPAPKTEVDFRRILDNKDIDCVSIATQNHWHALMTIMACQAGKDVYVEKPVSWCISEGRRMVEAARKYKRVVQAGTNGRASKGRQEAMKLLREGVIGDLYMARAFFRNLREPIGIEQDAPVPQGVDYDLWLGPAPKRPFNPNRFHYNWHWNWEYGNGEIGNNGPHFADLIIEGLDKQSTLPTKIASHGGRYVWKDQGQTPNVQVASYQYEDGTIANIEVRNLPGGEEGGSHEVVTFYGSKGYMVLTLKGGYRTIVNGEEGPKGSGAGAHVEHVANFYDVVRSRKMSEQYAPIEGGHIGAALCHLANISYRLGRSVQFDPKTETFPGDAEASAMLTRDYRAPYVVPKEV